MNMSKKFKKFLLFTAAAAAVGSVLVYMDKKRKAEEQPLFEAEDKDNCNLTADTDSSTSAKTKTSRTYINLV